MILQTPFLILSSTALGTLAPIPYRCCLAQPNYGFSRPCFTHGRSMYGAWSQRNSHCGTFVGHELILKQPWKILTAIRYTCPALTLLYFVVASTFSVCTLQTVSQKAKDQHVRRDIILWLMLGVLCEYVSAPTTQELCDCILWFFVNFMDTDGC